MALKGKEPKICYEGRLVPLCGRYFWENNFGARLFCQMLGRSGGTVSNPEIDLTEDAYYVGECSSTDTHINTCHAGANDHTLGGSKFLGTASCNKGSEAVAYINCDGKVFLIFYIPITFSSFYCKTKDIEYDQSYNFDVI